MYRGRISRRSGFLSITIQHMSAVKKPNFLQTVGFFVSFCGFIMYIFFLPFNVFLSVYVKATIKSYTSLEIHCIDITVNAGWMRLVVLRQTVL